VGIRLSRNDLEFDSALALISDTKPNLLFHFGCNHIHIFFYYPMTLKMFHHRISLLVRLKAQHPFLFMSALSNVI
jgi:hypothetical protein